MTMHSVTHQSAQPAHHASRTQGSPSARSWRRRHAGAPWAGAAAVSAAALLALATASPASAHDQLLSASPAAGTAVIKTPSELNLTFSGNLITGEGISNVATVTDENGHQWQDGEAAVSGPELSAALCEGMPNGEYAVSYRVVYSDGHSEEKSYDFTLEDPSAPEEGVPEDCGVVNPDAPVSSDATAQDSSTDDGASATAGTGGTSATEPAPSGSAAGTATDSTTQDPGEATAEGSQAPAAAVPGWVWAAAIGGVIVVLLAMLMVFRKAKGIDTGSDASDRGGPGTDHQ
ncbi:copper resistance CopC family protein [Microbacterium sp. A93]|uniref:copper resistance CopC family protein n=1 Tax=Microbacterium sp. A93 TaxID=3450716 RepID=UPI003F4392A4